MAETIALVGGESLLGREVSDAIGQSRLSADVRLVAAPGEEEGKLTGAGGEPAVITKFSRDAFDGANAVVLACSAETARQVESFGLDATLIDLSYGLEALPSARLRAPQAEAYDFRVAHDAIQEVAHPAAIALALVLGRLYPVFPFTRAIAHVFEPASERGKPGLEELQAQSVSLLSFKPLPKAVFDTQASYVMLPRFGGDAPVSLAEIESRIERHLATLLANTGGAPVPSLRLIQAPVFHGYSMSLWIEFADGPGADAPAVAALEQVLDEFPLTVSRPTAEPPNNVSVAGEGTVAIGAIAPDWNQRRAMWLWIAADNLRLTADNTVKVLEEVL